MKIDDPTVSTVAFAKLLGVAHPTIHRWYQRLHEGEPSTGRHVQLTDRDRRVLWAWFRLSYTPGTTAPPSQGLPYEAVALKKHWAADVVWTDTTGDRWLVAWREGARIVPTVDKAVAVAGDAAADGFVVSVVDLDGWRT
jgi:hypothetical protein